MSWTITFQQPSPLPSLDLRVAWVFPFLAVDSSFLGAPEEKSRTSPHLVTVTATIQLVHTWGFIFATSIEDIPQAINDRYNLMKVLFEYGKRHVVQKLKEAGTLALEEKIDLNTSNAEVPCMFDPSRIQDPINAQCVVDMNTSKSQETSNSIISGGVNIQVDGDLNVGGDIVGRDKSISEQQSDA